MLNIRFAVTDDTDRRTCRLVEEIFDDACAVSSTITPSHHRMEEVYSFESLHVHGSDLRRATHKMEGECCVSCCNLDTWDTTEPHLQSPVDVSDVQEMKSRQHSNLRIYISLADHLLKLSVSLYLIASEVPLLKDGCMQAQNTFSGGFRHKSQSCVAVQSHVPARGTILRSQTAIRVRA